LERLRADEALVPSLWWFEVRNTLIVSERRGRLTEADTAAFLRGLSRLGVIVDRAPDEAAVLTLARRYRLTVYDASYLELAQRETLPIATLDKDLRAAAQAAGTALLGES
jgi:predicted nucleic acid-binding protein